MSAKFFIDTNVFVYSFDSSQPAKRDRSLALIQEALTNDSGMISTQVLQEFLNVALTKFNIPMKVQEAVYYLKVVLNPLCQVYPDLALFENSLVLQSETGYSFYDALILSAADKAGCEVLYTEDLQHGQEIRGIKVLNPFL